MRAVKFFVAGTLAFMVCALIMFGVVKPGVEWLAAATLAATGSKMLSAIAVMVPFAAFFGLVVALTA